MPAPRLPAPASLGVASRPVTFAALQTHCTWDLDDNLARHEALVRQAAAEGAQVILPQELFHTPYFCADQDPRHFAHAHALEAHPALSRMAALAAELGVVIPVSVFEAAGNAFFNTLVVVDADGRRCATYRKSHIPQGPGYEEKYFFSPGDTGFHPVETRFGRLGVAVCWDQWFPEVARVLALRGAEVLLYPSAIGSEPNDPDHDSAPHWRAAMVGHAAANMVPVVASNRVGSEANRSATMRFYGTSFIAGPYGQILADAGRDREAVILATVDLAACARDRAAWGLFRDRRPELYGALLTLDGTGAAR